MRTSLLLLALSSSMLLSGCSIKQMAMNAVADTLSGGTGGSFSTDEDLQFVGEALPFGLKLMEGVNDGVPEHVGMKLTLASGFAQYAAVYVEWPAERDYRFTDLAAYEKGLKRAKGFYMRANAYAVDGLSLMIDDFETRIFTDTDAVMTEATAEHVPLLFWYAGSLLLSIAADFTDTELIAAFPIAQKAMMRAYELDPLWNRATIPSSLISLAPNLPGGKPEDALKYFDQTMEVTQGLTASPYVSLATAMALKQQDREKFTELLQKAIAVDLDDSPDDILANQYAQQRAAFLLEHIDDLIL